MKITEAATGVYAVESAAVNWTLVVDGDDVTLVDAGYPGDHDDVLASLDQIGRRLSDVRAVLVTHAHIDHIGSIPQLLDQHDMPVLASSTEAAHVRREDLEQAGTSDVLLNLWRPRMLPWAVHIMRNGAMKDRGVPSATDFGSADTIDVPGRPMPIPTPGHTSGHTAYLFPAARVLLTGDALVTGHMLSAITGPQEIMGFFHHDAAGMEASIDAIAAVDADAIVPGHGPVYRGSPKDAVAELRRRRDDG
jgi:glyoxylase-like metal-dependent hydrolase (beta-lactamase superfamily II)